jgi:hypothetical protein
MNELAFVKLGIYRFTLWYGNFNSRTLIGKEKKLTLVCYARFLTSFGCPYFVMYLLLWFIKVNPRLIISDVKKLFAKDRLLYLGNCFNICLEILTRASFGSFVRRWGIHLVHFLLILNHVWALYSDTNVFSYIPSCINSNQILYFLTIFGEVAVFGRRA